MPIIYFLEMLLLAALWGLSFYFMRASGHEFGPVTLVFLRTLLAALFLTPILVRRHLVTVTLKHWRPLFMIGLLNSALPFTLFSLSTLTLEAGLTSILNATAPMFGALIGAFWLKTPLKPSNLVGIFVGFFGVSILVSGQGFTANASIVAIIAAISGSLCYGIAACYSKKYLNNVPAMAVTAGSQWMAALMLLIPGLLYWPSQPVSQQAWLHVVLLGILSTAFAYVIYYHLINAIGAVKAITVAYLVPVFGVLWGALLLAETLSTNQLMGGGLILLGVSLATGISLRKKKSPSDVAS